MKITTIGDGLEKKVKKTEEGSQEKHEEKVPKGVELEAGEKVVLLVRQHWFVFRDPVLIMVFLPFIFMSLTFYLDLIQINEFFRKMGGQMAIYLAAISFIFGLIFFLWRFYLWQRTFYLVTNKRLILVTQLGMFSHDDREAGLSMIQDVRASVDGLQPTLYGYGDVIVQVSSQDSQLVLQKVPHPRQVQHAIIRDAHLL